MASRGSTLIATHSGLRGRPGAELSDEVVARTVAGLLELIRLRGLSETLGVARDERSTSAELATTVGEFARERGADVIDFGVLTTPALKLAARSRGLGGAVMVTGSHLDPSLNGLKLVAGPHYGPLDIRLLPDPAEPPAGRRGKLSGDGLAVREHVAAIIHSIDAERIRAAGLSVTCAGGAGPAPSLLLDELGCRPEAPRADLGLVLDPDGDRVQLIDERGAELDAELTLPIAMLALDARAIVKGADTSRMVDVLAEARGGSVRVVAPGEIHLIEAVTASEADLAGEGNGGVVIPAVGLARDGLAAGAAVLWLLARTGKPLSELAAELPRYARRRSTVPCRNPSSGRNRLEDVSLRLGVEMADSDTGVRVKPSEEAWGLVRISATEPVFRVTAEAPTEAEAEELHSELLRALDAGAQAGESN